MSLSTPAVLRASPPSKQYDVCIVGSGAAGGIAAKVLTEAGMDTVLLEAGPALDPASDFKQHLWPYDLSHRGSGIGGREDELIAPHSFWHRKAEPYSRTEGTEFYWFRSRALGGRTNHWGQAAMRFDPNDFKPFSTRGSGEDWPLSYEDLESYYAKTERCIGVFGPSDTGTAVGRDALLPPPKPRCTELLIKSGCAKLGLPCVPPTMSILTRSINGRSSCHYCGQCYRGCKTASCFSSSQVLIPSALATGKLALITNAVAYEVLIARDGRACGIGYIDKETNTSQELVARIVVLAASACESARLLLNSKSSAHPNGVANSSGVVGRYLMESVGSMGEGYFSQLEQLPPHNHDGTGGAHLFIPRSTATESRDGGGGFHIEFGGGRRVPSVAEFDDLCDELQGYGPDLKRACRQRYGSTISFLCLGDTSASADNYCEIDPDLSDTWGIPSLRFHFRRAPNDFSMAAHMQSVLKDLVESSGGRYLTKVEPTGPHANGITAAGQTHHEVGTVRMGSDPRKSALNGFCQAHEVKNLFVVDGGSFVSLPDKTPTLTILALSWRASEYLLEEARLGNI